MKENMEYKKLLKESGLKNTKHRINILEILKCVDQPITAENIYQKLLNEKCSINLSTVYRTLETLFDKELILKHSVLNENRILFEYNNKVHKHYIVCKCCKRMFAIENCPLREYEKLLELETGFMIIGHKLSIYGYCPECQKKGMLGK